MIFVQEIIMIYCKEEATVRFSVEVEDANERNADTIIKRRCFIIIIVLLLSA